MKLNFLFPRKCIYYLNWIWYKFGFGLLYLFQISYSACSTSAFSHCTYGAVWRYWEGFFSKEKALDSSSSSEKEVWEADLRAKLLSSTESTLLPRLPFRSEGLYKAEQQSVGKEGLYENGYYWALPLRIWIQEVGMKPKELHF